MPELGVQLLVALGLRFVIEGAAYALAPSFMRRVIAAALNTPDEVLRWSGAVAAVLGVGLVWLLVG